MSSLPVVVNYEIVTRSELARKLPTQPLVLVGTMVQIDGRGIESGRTCVGYTLALALSGP